LGEKQKALDYHSQALPLRRTVEDHQGEAYTLLNLGSIYNSLGEAQKALEYYNQALPLMRVIGDRRGEAGTLGNIASVYKNLSEYQKALDYYGQALHLFRAGGDRRTEARVLNNVGQIYRDLGERQKALDHYGQALPLHRAVGDRQGEASTLTNIGLVYSDLGEKQKALEFYNQGLLLSRAVGYRQGEATMLHNIGAIYDSLGERQKALDYYGQALLLKRAVGDPNGEAVTLYRIARVERDRGDLIEARAQIEAALAITESLRAKIASQELRASYLASKQHYYDFYVDLLMRLYERQPSEGHDAAALQASERARARSLLETLTEARADIRQGVDPALLEREQSLHQQLNAKAERLTRLLSGKHTDEQAAAARKEVDDLLTQYQEVQGQIRAKSPHYAALTQPQPLSLKEIQQQVLDEDTLLLEYALGEERSFLWAVTATSITSFELPRRSEVEGAARRVYGRLRNKDDAHSPEALSSLSRMLLGPVADQLEKKRLVIVSDGALQYVPFAALPVPRLKTQDPRPKTSTTGDQRLATSDQPLIVDHEIINLPSASVLAVLRRELAGRQPAAKAVAVLADPVFEKTDPRVKTQDPRPKTQDLSPNPQSAIRHPQSVEDELTRSARQVGLNGFPRLLGSRQKAEQIVALAATGQRLKAVDFAASKPTAIGATLGQYRLVHFATHGLLNSEHPELSGLVLSLVNEHGEPQDGFLRLHEVYNLELGADLVVLSACQTALGKEIRGEGLIGLTRGFMYAGAPRVVASLWDVSDEATARLMNRFYEGMLKRGLRPAAALRQVQLSLWKERRWKSPSYWAGFVFQGEWR
jgi:CHAT domain-containing protein/Tfp pilus assembly protein PilF